MSDLLLASIVASVFCSVVAVVLHGAMTHAGELVKRAAGVMLIIAPSLVASIVTIESASTPMDALILVAYMLFVSTLATAAGTAYAYYRDYEVTQ